MFTIQLSIMVFILFTIVSSISFAIVFALLFAFTMQMLSKFRPGHEPSDPHRSNGCPLFEPL